MSKTKERIRDSQLRYQQGLGQNFIYDDDLLEQLVIASGVGQDDCVLEIGPGAASLTGHLCDHAKQVVSVELDERLLPIIRVSMEKHSNFTLVQGDAMTVDLKALAEGMDGPVSVVANIPYYITTPLIQRILTCGLKLKTLAVMVQKEVADKLVSSPGEDGWGMLALRCQYLADVHRAMEVPASCFTPVPKVDSTFVVMQMREKPAVEVRSEENFFRVAQAGFAQRRKTMTNGLCAAFHMERPEALQLMEAAGLDSRVRGEKLTMEELARLSDVYTERQGEPS
ncbi:MAG: 16S rRNA (adenine(1518)-N(6)/adenine(1519)-N(6))-dimethyltransferase RsmA [Clostridiales bacterium]|nr:16S rRNA (adenine(1518)-N(6)/adenine(1519)-N(6))-dimethyltransferase RsmA [Clostridiales bacterium]